MNKNCLDTVSETGGGGGRKEIEEYKKRAVRIFDISL